MSSKVNVLYAVFPRGICYHIVKPSPFTLCGLSATPLRRSYIDLFPTMDDLPDSLPLCRKCRRINSSLEQEF